MKVRYIGPFAEVELREFGITVERNHQAEIPDGIGATLVEQADWEEVGKPKSKDQQPPAPTEG